jgi:hypothetical protein
VGQTINPYRQTQPRWCAVANSDLTGLAWSWNHRSAHAAEQAALAPLPRPAGSTVGLRNEHHHCGRPRPSRRGCLPLGRPPSCTHACQGALARCLATYPPSDPDGDYVWLALVLDARHDVLYQH